MDAFTFLILGLGVALGFFVQTVAGFAAAPVALPILLSVFSIQESVALLSVYFFLISVILVSKNYRLMDRRAVFELGVASIVGMVLGVVILKLGKPIILKRALGAFILFFVGFTYIQKTKIELFKKLGVLFGLTGGFFAGLFSTGGPLFVVYIYNKIKKSRNMRATIIGMTGLTGFLRVPALMMSGMFTYNTVLTAVYALPFFVVSVYLGKNTYKRIDEKTFQNMLRLILTLSGISLIMR